MKNITTLLLAFLVIAFSAVTTTIQAQNTRIDPEQSKLEWEGSKIIGSKHFGTVSIKDGYLVSLDDGFAGEFIINMNTITSTDLADNKDKHDKLVGHLKSDDFFSVEKHPTARFKISKAVPAIGKEGTNYLVTGDLTIKGITNRISFPARVDLNENKLASATFVIDRSKWDVRYGSGSFFDDLGNSAISDEIVFTITLIAD